MPRHRIDGTKVAGTWPDDKDMKKKKSTAVEPETDPTERSLIEEAEDILQIEETRLNRECVRLPNQYRMASFQAAQIDRDIAETQAEKDVFEAELQLKIRKEPEMFELEKITEGAIKEIVATNEDVQKLDKKLRRLRHQRDLFKALVNGLEMKKRSLTNLVELHAAGWYAEVRPSSEGREAMNKLSRERLARPIPRDRKERERA